MSGKFQVKVVPSEWIVSTGHRLDCNPYVSGAKELREKIAALPVPKDELQYLTGGISGIVNAGRIPRSWVQDHNHGYPFLSSTDILQSDISNLSYISKKTIRSNPQLLIHDGWTLITRAGTVGRTVYVRADMDGLACTGDVLRVIPDDDKVLPGYLYAFLKTRYGVPMVISGTYGSIITNLEPSHLADLPVPRLGAVEQQVHDLVQQAANLRVEASDIITNTSRNIEVYFRLWDDEFNDKAEFVKKGFYVDSAVLTNTSRFEATYHDSIATEVSNRISRIPNRKLMDICSVFKPGMFKRIIVDTPKQGYGLIPGSELFALSPKPAYWVSPRTQGVSDCIMQPYWILIQAFGQVGGLIGRCIVTTQNLDGYAATDLQIQLRFAEPLETGYVFAFLYSRPGYKLLTRLPIGGSIPHIHPKDVENLYVPWGEKTFRDAVGQNIIEAWTKRNEATNLEDQARALVERAIEEGGQ